MKILVYDSNNNTVEFEATTIHYFNESSRKFGDLGFIINAPVVVILSADEIDKKNISGNIVLFKFVYGIDEIALLLKVKGAAAVVMNSTPLSTRGRANFQLWRPRREVDLPTLQISPSGYAYVKKACELGVTNITLISDEFVENPYYYLTMGFGLFATIAGSIFFVSLMTGCIVIFSLLYHSGKVAFNIKILLLCAVFFTSLYRLIFCLVDPFGSHLILPGTYTVFTHIFNIPATIICELLLSLYWFEKLFNMFKEEKIYMITRIPFSIICGIFVIGIITSFFGAVFAPLLMLQFVTILAYIYSLIWLLLSTFHLIVAFLINLRVNSIKKKTKKRKSRIFIIKVIFICMIDSILITGLFCNAYVNLPPGLIMSISCSHIFFTGAQSLIILTLFNWSLVIERSSHENLKKKQKAEALN
jgi:hypothetical protein